MHVRRLQLANFRNYRDLDLNLAPGPQVFLGDNAQGKSNLLEALYLLATARSVRTARDGEMIAWGAEAAPQPFARVLAEVERRGGPVQLEAFVAGAAAGPAPSAVRAGKRLRVNGIPRRAQDLVGQMRAALFTANDLQIVTGAPAERRRFLDFMLSQMDRRYYAALQRYGRVLQQRNAVLRRIKEGDASPDELTFWDEALAREAAEIVCARLVACAKLSRYAADAHGALSASAEALRLSYEPRTGDNWRPMLPAGRDVPGAARLLLAALVSGRRRDVAAATTLIGPHRDDLALEIDGVSAAAFASRAQVRTATLALRLAEARLLGEDLADPPVVLLDDIVSELDQRRRHSVLEGLDAFDQVWLTATDAGAFPREFLARAAVFEVRSGRVTERGSA